MLETKNLYKIYKPKKGVPVTALDDVTIQFPETGMVFLLGKSGSGKSTLLNVLGGLDKYDSGEITIKGVSSKTFKQQHFDSYRNTYIGFIFQEYNILEDFTVGANIALAIELQGRKADDGQINEILKEVDLDGYGNRKPNELSGGQKQRVAIARALVKNPEIIMADEPTGALDSNTGKQVLDTLKKLSKNKLVIVVSHDREFAEQYADRIIELHDGKVISDVELDTSCTEENADSLTFHENTIDVPKGYHITEEDRIAINEYIDKLSSASLEITVFKNKKSAKRFCNTDISKIKENLGSEFKLIKSKLPLKNAFKIGASGLKYKKIRLVFTVLLSCVAFGLFGLSDTFGSYNHINTCTQSIIDTGVKYTAIEKTVKSGEGVNAYWGGGYYISDDNLKEFTKHTGIEMTGVYTPIGTDLSFMKNFNPDVELTKSEYSIYRQGFNGFAEITEKTIKDMDMKLVAGVMPNGGKDEIAVSTLVFETFKMAGYWDAVTTQPDGKGGQKPVYTEIKNFDDLIGKTLDFNGKKYIVTGVIDTNMDIDRYRSINEDHSKDSKAEKIVTFALANEFMCTANYSLADVAMVGEGYVQGLIENHPHTKPILNGYMYYYADNSSIDASYMAKLDDIKSVQSIIWLDGEKASLAKNEMIVTSDMLGEAEPVYDENGNPSVKALTEEDCKRLIGNNKFKLWGYNNNEEYSLDDCRIVGVIPITDKNIAYSQTVVTDDGTYEMFTSGSEGAYKMAVGAMPAEKQDIKSLVSHCYNEDGNVRYSLMNSVTYELDTVNDVLKTLSKVFLYIGLGFALFAAIMLANFIATSISHKKQEIGILRAIGSRSNDVFRIFFSESFIIAMINFVLSCIGVFCATMFINYIIRSETGILITILSFGIRQILLLFAVSTVVAFAASFLPVRRIASKRPIDAIRNR